MQANADDLRAWRRWVIALLLLTLTLLCCASTGLAQTQDYPLRTVRIVTAEAGGSNDIASRIIAQPLGAALGQTGRHHGRRLLWHFARAHCRVVTHIFLKRAPHAYLAKTY